MFSFFKKKPQDLQLLQRTVTGLLGKKPKNLTLYQLAFKHSSVSKDSNERLEFLGDAILGAVVADYLFKKFPYKDEGFLTEIRSRIVKRESLNSLALKLGLDKIIVFQKGNNSQKSIYGNALEAFIGAIYLDLGYKACFHFIISNMISPYIDLKETIENNRNFKSMLIEWAQKNEQSINFKIIHEEGLNHNKEFTSQVVLGGKALTTGKGFSKKKAEQAAAEKTCIDLGIIQEQ